MIHKFLKSSFVLTSLLFSVSSMGHQVMKTMMKCGTCELPNYRISNLELATRPISVCLGTGSWSVYSKTTNVLEITTGDYRQHHLSIRSIGILSGGQITEDVKAKTPHRIQKNKILFSALNSQSPQFSVRAEDYDEVQAQRLKNRFQVLELTANGIELGDDIYGLNTLWIQQADLQKYLLGDRSESDQSAMEVVYPQIRCELKIAGSR